MNSTATSADHAQALTKRLQARLVDGLTQVAQAHGSSETVFSQTGWLRDEGIHGGGNRFVAKSKLFNRASVNFSHVHYDNDLNRPLRSATALSAIIHPDHPRAPSLHTHLSWTEMRSGQGSWRLMADLNPSIENEEENALFAKALATATPEHIQSGRAQGDKYFFIPSLGRHRGTVHFYLEGHASDSRSADLALANRFGDAVIDTYCTIVDRALADHQTPTDDERAQQLAYHSLYFLQVLTLDRGTTSGLLVHNQNDLGILGSLPSHVDRSLLSSWVKKLPSPQDELLTALIQVLADDPPSPVTNRCKQQLAQTIRDHYQRHPDALAQQASGFTLPPTVANHTPTT